MELTKLKKEERVLLQLLPQLIWNIIFGYLEHFQDSLECISKSSPILRHWIGNANQYLFSKVLPLLEPELHPKQPPLLPPLQILAKLRLVCRAWNKTVETLAHPSASHYRSCLVTRLTAINIPYNEPRIQDADFYSHFEDSHPADETRSPFVGGFVRIFYGDNVSLDPSPFGNTLLKYGHQVRFCEITIATQFLPGSNEAKRALVDLWNELPNVESLILIWNPKYLLNNCNFDDGTSMAFDMLPERQNLRHLQAKGIMYQILAKLVIKAPNLEHLDVGYMTPFVHYLVSQKHMKQIVDKVPNLSLRHLGVHVMTKYPHCFGEQLPCNRDEGFHKAFESLAAQHGLLIRSLELMVTCSKTAVWFEWRRHSFNFPNLRSVKLITRNWPCIDFLVRVKNTLEYLCIEVDAQETFAKWLQRPDSAELIQDEKIKFFGCYNNMTESNIWELMPKLKEVTVRVLLPKTQKLRETIWKRSIGKCSQKWINILELAENVRLF